MTEPTLIITDGACIGNPGPGAWAAIVAVADQVLELAGTDRDTTNNRMELQAVISGLECALKHTTGDMTIVLDSKYVMEGASSSLARWKKNGWKTQAGTEVQNQDLWERIDPLVSQRKLHWRVVRGHQGIPSNERVNELATRAAKLQSIQGLHLYAGPRHQYRVSFALPDPTLAKIEPYYLSFVDGTIRRHKTWKECESVVKGRSAKFKKIHSALEEASTLQSWGAKVREA